ncbi:MAG: hypothetical protein UX57_C0027G0001, partial [Candidatus Uhrbacteria bacterium GW2011_GWE2_46_68]
MVRNLLYRKNGQGLNHHRKPHANVLTPPMRNKPVEVGLTTATAPARAQ